MWPGKFCRNFRPGHGEFLPVDVVITKELRPHSTLKSLKRRDPGGVGADIGPETVELFQKIIGVARMVLWNGPLGARISSF